MTTFSDRLSHELERWVADGVVSREQAEAIRGRYRDDEAAERRGRLVTVIALVGAIVAGLGVILFFAANWDAIPRPSRLVLLVLAILAAYGAADRLRHSRPRVAHACVVLGVILYGASIFLVGQMYHVSTHDPAAFLLWTLGAIPVAVLWRSLPVATLSLVTLAAWQGHELFGALPDDTAAGAIGVVGMLYGTALYALGTGFEDRLRLYGYAAPMRALGLLIASATLFVLTFRGVADALHDQNPLGHGSALLLAVALLLLTLAGAGAMWGSRPREALAVGAVACLGLLPALVSVPTAVFVVAFGLLALGLIAAGIDADEPWLVNAGVVFVGAELVARFFDLFSRMLPRSGAFLVAGLLLLGLAAALERGRSHLLERMRG